ncbi:hypothetical protein PMAYCL1PPCAC_29319, partial [Pristionchus mayeri]
LSLAGSARGWTDYKARRNLWRPSGQGLIVMHCRCLCEKGNVHPPEEVVLAERILVETREDKRKKTKKRDLPVINMNGGANVEQARMQARLEREERMEDDRNIEPTIFHTPYNRGRTRTNSVTSSLHSRLYRQAATIVLLSPLRLHGKKSRCCCVDEGEERREEERGIERETRFRSLHHYSLHQSPQGVFPSTRPCHGSAPFDEKLC